MVALRVIITSFRPPRGVEGTLAAKPRIFIPTLYFIEGLPFTIVNNMSVAFFKTLAMNNESLAFFTSLLYIPWTYKLFWAPLIDLYKTRRAWIIGTQIALTITSALLMVAVFMPQSTVVLLIVFTAMAFVSATQDVAIDGYYLDVLDKEQQDFYVGVRGTAYKVAWLFGSGALVYLAGIVAEKSRVPGANAIGWCSAFGVCTTIFALFAYFHARVLPVPVSDHLNTTNIANANYVDPTSTADTMAASAESAGKGGGVQEGFVALLKALPVIFKDFCAQPRIHVIFLYILIFRLGDALLMKMAQPFLLDPPQAGGLGLSVADVGKVYGGVGTIFLLIGGISGSALISRIGLSRCIIPFALIQNSSLLLYWYLAMHKPDIVLVCIVNAFEQFSYGLGTSSYMVFLLSTVKPRYKASQFAIVTALMAYGVMLPGMGAGLLQSKLGYANFFLVSFFASLPGIITIPFLPMKQLAARRAEQ
jgi:PAT family beta-lactamase induction signal transducer AmpG